jgi:hypothetical protein
LANAFLSFGYVDLGVHSRYHLLRKCRRRAFRADVARIAAAGGYGRHWQSRDGDGSGFGGSGAQHSHDVPAGNRKYVVAAPPTLAQHLGKVRQNPFEMKKLSHLDDVRVGCDGGGVRGYDADAVKVRSEAHAFDAGDATDVLDMSDN